MLAHGLPWRTAANAFAIGAGGGCYSLLARPIANASYQLVAPSNSEYSVLERANSEYSVLERANSEYSLLERIRYWSSTGLIAAEKGECAHPQELAARMRNEVTTTWEESLRGIANLQALAPTTVVSWCAILTHFASLVKPGGDGEKLKKENAALREKLDDALMRLELLKGTSGGGPQKYTVPLFNTCFTDVCSWNTWRDQALAWAKENPMVLGTPANALSWFSRLLSGSAHAFVVGEIPRILANTTTIYEAVLAATTLLNPLFADPDAERRAIENSGQ